MVFPTHFAKGKEYPDSDGFITVARRRKLNSMKMEIQNETKRPSFSNKSFAEIAASTNVFCAIGFGEEPTEEGKETLVEAGENKETSTEETALICWKPLCSPSEQTVSIPETEKRVRFAANHEIIELNEINEPVEEEEKFKMPTDSTHTKTKTKIEKMDYQMKKMDLEIKKMDLKMKKMEYKAKKMDYRMKEMDYKLKKRAFETQVRKSLPHSEVSSRPSSRDSNRAQLAKAKLVLEHESLQRMIFPL
ncbi:hypothetical protein EJF18_20855 [Clavispora lusitaniae]|uniref:Uncharacterized protein n=1 Tax=Clavispora lusitaniae TaxID=36911 RepID=A0ACD0WI01_CLALS|nr:hypothetical protein EJF14_20855 [Clavispora lusitaniae]QFZ32602.1 hypothetical protein EJF16_20855 [Clavispora lusitaniae]QFZ38271.1 hypothetical protein EJF15_20855 [Clavispora lusitaniae]QFZ43954.1 hypothetical protein EJF18_20855 [Clavispora lusitaniae]QFZ49631.1 hypothetical protein EJF17_20855 [Clavispora lusitaniae]